MKYNWCFALIAPAGRFALFCSVLFAIQADAQLLPAGRLPGGVLWTNYTIGVNGGIPNRTTIYTTFSPGATAAQINNAIANCPANEVIYLNPGTYVLTDYLTWQYPIHSYVTLRGAGVGQTILEFTNVTRGQCIYIRGSDQYTIATNSALADFVYGGYSQGSTNLSLVAPLPAPSTYANPQIGDLIILDQQSDFTNLVNPIGNADGGAAVNQGRESGIRAESQGFTLVAIDSSGTNITIWPPVYMTNWTANALPQLYWCAYRGGAHGIGIENMTIIGCPGNYNIEMDWCQDCWIENVDSELADQNHVSLFRDKNITIADSYFHLLQSYQSDSYGIHAAVTFDSLFQNNIFNQISSPVIMDSGSAGNVIAYNYATNLPYSPSPQWLVPMIAFHGAHPDMNLIEGNVGQMISLDFIHGSSSHNTIFRNYISGQLPDGSANNNTFPIQMMAWNRDESVIGNVLGYNGYHNNYEDSSTNIVTSPTSIYQLGFYNNASQATQSGYTNDDGVVQTVVRTGNYDYVTHSTVWDGNGAQTLPASLYLTGRPAWWSNSVPWPPIGGDLSPMISAIPAQLRYLAMMNPTVITSNAPPALAPPQDIHVMSQ